jgi:putative PIN family toxin of toxin-antitoxin system
VKIFFDTNVLISAFLSRGLCADIFRISVSEFDVVIGEYVLSEFENKLEKKFKIPESRISEIVSFLHQFEIIPVPQSPFNVKMIDKEDPWVIASAKNGKARFLVTGDKEMLSLPRIIKIKIIRPREFFERYNQKKLK